MRLTRSRLGLVAAVAIGGGAALALVLPAGAAVSVASQSPPVQALQLSNEATLDAKGAVVFAPIQVVCPAGFASGTLTVSVTENVGGAIASGSTTVGAPRCDGTVHAVQLAVTPTQEPFKKGVAYGTASVDLFGGPNGFQTLTDQHNIQIVKR